MRQVLILLGIAGALAPGLRSQSGEQVLLIYNQQDAVSRQIAEYYRPRRSIPLANLCPLSVTTGEEISWEAYQSAVERPVAACLAKERLQEKILYLVTVMGVPLKVAGGGSGLAAEFSSVDSELALLYSRAKGVKLDRAGPVPNPYFMKRDEPFRHPRFPIYLVTRLAAYDLAGVKAMIDRSLAARNRGKFVIDLNSGGNESGNGWLRTAAILLPAGRVVLDETPAVLERQRDVIGYASWGSNDANRKRRMLGFQWLPGAVATDFVSTNGRTFKRPPGDWTFTTWADRAHFFAGSPQSLSADYLQEGATGASGNVYEPTLAGCARPDYLFPAYFEGRTLAESYYMALPFLSWQEVILGDPLCSLGKP